VAADGKQLHERVRYFGYSRGGLKAFIPIDSNPWNGGKSLVLAVNRKSLYAPKQVTTQTMTEEPVPTRTRFV